MLLSPCGIDCEACQMKESCGGGCQICGGKPFYIKDFGVETCPMYDCSVNKHGYKTCAECPEVPCQIFFDWKDPGMTDEQHVSAVNANVALLKESLKGDAV
ncbi:MAG: DUF3795 domain-containing protein [Oscillospiraceae bacterium]|nr:DUF3795 domain-containing protein [Oscillospiraceae bacterium]